MFAALAQSDVAYQDCVARCHQQEAQGASFLVSCETGCGTVAQQTGRPVKTSPLTVLTTEKPDCAWYQSPNRIECTDFQHGVICGPAQYSGCKPNWLIIGGLASVAGLLLFGRLRS